MSIVPSRYVAGLICAAVLVTGLSVYRQYGISWDEPVQRQYGRMVYEYVRGDNEELLADRHRVYGPVFELLLYSIEKGLGLEDSRDVYLMRHLVTFIMFAVGVAFFLGLASRMFRSWKMGLVGAVFLIVSPRIFAHSFYNSKDIPFMSMFVVCMYTLLLYLDTKRWWAPVVHGACCAVLVDIRVMGIFVPLITVGFLGYHAVSGRMRGVSRAVLRFGLFTITFVPLVILFWPTLWTDPIGNFASAFDAMRRFPWDATVLFMGRNIRSTDLPPYYTAVWILITVPLAYIVLSWAGVVAAVRRLGGRNIGIEVRRRDAMLALIWLFVPLVFLVASGAVLYDTWRHTFFVYPAVLLLALMGLGWVLRSVKTRVVALGLIIIVAVNVAGAVAFMIRSHPHQNVYFNSIVGGVPGAAGRYEMDYWGLSYRSLLESLLQKDGRAAVRVYSLNEPGYYNSFMLEPAARSRLVYVDDIAGADYYLTNFRWDPLEPPEEAEFVSVEVDGVNLSAAYRVR